MIFAGMSGVAQADAAGLGVVEVKAMRKEGFDPAFAAAVSAASAIIGPIIPPCVIMVVYAVLAQVSVADLFLAGILPGILMGWALMGDDLLAGGTGRVARPVEPQRDVFRDCAGLPPCAAGACCAGAACGGPARWRRDADRARRADGGLRHRRSGFCTRELTWTRPVRRYARNRRHLRRAGVHHRRGRAVRLVDRRSRAAADRSWPR